MPENGSSKDAECLIDQSMEVVIGQVCEKLGLSYGVVKSGDTVTTASSSLEDVAKRRDPLIRRLRGYEKFLETLRNPSSGFVVKDRRKGLQTYKMSFSGQDLIAWMLEKGGFLYRDEALGFATMIFDAGYIVSFELLEKFVPDGSLYALQAANFYPSQASKPTELDYLVYLEKREQKGSEKYRLEEHEEHNLTILRKKFHAQADTVRELLTKHRQAVKELKDNDRKLYHLMEYYFWRTQRPPPTKNFDGMDATREFISESDMEATMKPEALARRLEHQVESRQIHSNMSRVKASTASKSLIEYSTLMKHRDPFIDDILCYKNPYILNDEELFKYERHASAEDLKLWQYSLNLLLQDIAGIYYFQTFLQKELSEENLEFYLAVEDLKTTTSSHGEYDVVAKQILDTFIKEDAPKPINIESTVRNQILKSFETSTKGKKPIDYYVFEDAQKHIFHLMAKDTYTRFLNSDVLKDALRNSMNLDHSFQKKLAIGINNTIRGSKSLGTIQGGSGSLSVATGARVGATLNDSTSSKATKSKTSLPSMVE